MKRLGRSAGEAMLGSTWKNHPELQCEAKDGAGGRHCCWTGDQFRMMLAICIVKKIS